MLKVIISLFIVISCSYANGIKTKKLEIYNNGSFITKELSLANTKLKIPKNIAIEQITIQEQNGCKLINYELKAILNVDDSLVIEIQNLTEQKKKLSNKVSSLNHANKLLNTIDLAKSKSDLAQTRQMAKFYENKIFENLSSIDEHYKSISKVDKKIKELQKQQQNRQFNNLSIEISCKSSNTVTALVTYPIYNLKRKSFYRVDADSEKGEISIKNSIFLTQSSGEDFNNIDLYLYTYTKTNAIQPREFYPQYLDVNHVRKFAKSLDSIASMESSVASSSPKSKYQDSQTKSYYHVENVTLKKGVQTPIVLSSDKYRANFSVEIDGYSSSTPFFKTSFKPTKFYNRAKTKIYLDSSYVGSRFIQALKQDKKSDFYFGEDMKIEIEKTLKKDFTDEHFFSKNKITKTKIYEYKITNRHNQKVNITLTERVPVSKHEDIKVEPIEKPPFSKKESNGKVIWSFSLKPSESKTIEFGYKVDAPKGVFVP